MVDITTNSDYQPSMLIKANPTEIEVRIVIWKCKDLKPPEGAESLDAMITATIMCDQYQAAEEIQETDVHYGSTGDAEFNWRIVYSNIVMPSKFCNVELKLFDFKRMLGNTLIGTVSLDLQKHVQKVAKDMDKIQTGSAESYIDFGGLSPEDKEIRGSVS